jgi:hypothetical protein
MCTTKESSIYGVSRAYCSCHFVLELGWGSRDGAEWFLFIGIVLLALGIELLDAVGLKYLF